MNYEQKALISGVGINLVSSIIGIIYYVITKSQALFLDAFISFILCISTIISLVVTKIINKKDNEKYPLGRYAIENLFLVFRSILMLLIIAYTLINGAITIIYFSLGKLENDLNINFIDLLIYTILMVGSCFLITLIYTYYNNKLKVKSEMISLEIKSSIYDGLVTLFATSSLTLFRYIDVLNPYQEIGDSITVIILSIFYLIMPIKELSKQIKILTDKRNHEQIEKRIKDSIILNYPLFNIYDVYAIYSEEIVSIYICLFPSKTIDSDDIHDYFKEINEFLTSKYPSSKIYLILTKSKLHVL